MAGSLPSPNLNNFQSNGTAFLDANSLIVPGFFPQFSSGDLTGPYSKPVIASGAVTAAKMAAGAAVANGALAPNGSGANLTGITASQVGAAAKGANSDITSITGLTTALTQGQGGTGATSLAAALLAVITALPTTLPSTSGQLWLNGGVVSVS